MPDLPCVKTTKNSINGKYAILVMNGNTHGNFSLAQLQEICLKLTNDYKLKVLLLGRIRYDNDKRLCSELLLKLPIKDQSVIINGYNDVFKTYELPELIKNAVIQISPNTGPYHMALLLNTPAVVVNVNDFTMTIKHDAPNIKYVHNDKLELAIKENNLQSYKKEHITIRDIPIQKILAAIDSILKETYP